MNFIFPGADRPRETPHFGTPLALSLPGGLSLYLLIDIEIPASQAQATVVYFHGNGEVVEDLDYVLPFFRRVNWATVLVEYPGFGHAPGKPGEAAFYQTALNAYDQVRRELFPRLPVVAAAWSLGTPVAAYLATRREVAHLLLLSAMTSMVEVAQGLFPMTPALLLKDAEFDTRHFWDKIRCPATLIHGTDDDLVPVDMGREIKRRLGPKAHYIEIPDTGHNDLYAKGAAVIDQEVVRIAKELAPS